MKKPIVFLIAFILLSFTAMAEDGYNASVNTEQVWRTVVDFQVHEVKIIDVTEDGDACGVSVDGIVQWINVKDSKRINGVYIKVFEAYPVHSQLQDTDTCKLFIGGSVSKVTVPIIQEVKKPSVPAVNNVSNASVIPAKKEANCTGCLKSEACYPYGTESGKQYCALSGIFEGKKQYGSECANDYECLNFLCIKNTCRMESVWEKVIKFFAGIFGK